ncbi:MAG TPA: copper resistance CopC family protein [Candidatus Binatia bacterium]|nr:copper resistance CopC family protein [Candidatus Binatia bacterium]
MIASRRSIRIKIFLSCASIILAAPSTVHAHARMVRSLPANNAEVAEPPARVEIWFNELLDEGFNSIEVFRAADVNLKQRAGLQKGEAVVDARDHTHLSVEVPPLPAGEYVVEWRVLSRDGHSAPGRFRFRIRSK